ncbi:DUF3352 domain-containing protein [Nocardioides sp. CER19]|uniref:DUF3352 domain-containing protein n=1 Tax=Nocardioides sp. CER19 TaxID=3038538 RepID=UPI002449FDC5|nr:DUF3352 domain-containing protein [Nocardioides sp. CER19]MDH2416684.1 DUF3352 domain-containing protein [Nocardioides sp. CER19]
MSDDFNDQSNADQLVIGGPEAPHHRKRWWIGGGVLGVIAIGGGAAAWAAVSFFSQGDQPAQALPDSTIGYVSVDLDPSGAQKIAALKLARKFPAFKDKVGLQTDDDVRKSIFDQLAEDSGCKIDFGKDIEPWLGSRLALAAVGEDKPFPVIVIQTTDEGKVDAGLEKLTGCDTASTYAWKTTGDWTVVAETQAHVDEVVAGTKKGSLADDPDFQTWTDKAGDSGIMTAYAAPAAGQTLAKGLDGAAGEADPSAASLDPFGVLGACPGLSDQSSSSRRMQAQLADFGGAAASLRISDDGLELEMTGDTRAFGGSALSGKPSGTPVISTLPADTAVAFGTTLQKGWTDKLTQSIQNLCGSGSDPQSIFGPLSKASGLDLPGDLEKLFGDSAALALGPNLDVEGLVNGGDPSDLPVALKVRGDKVTIDGVAAKLRQSLGAPAGVLEPVSGDDAVAVGLDKTYAGQVAKDGKLGSSDAFKSVVPAGDKATGVFFVNFDALDKTIKALATGDDDVSANLAPLKAFGVSGWTDGDDSHSLLKISVD